MRGRDIIAAMAVVFGVGMALTTSAARAQTDAVTFTKDIAPILQRSCQNCHRPDSLAPMSLITYEEVRPWAKAIKERTLLRGRRGSMPPWFIEKEIGIQKFKDDVSLTDVEIGKISRWADSGAPRGNPADMPPARVFADNATADRHTRSDCHVPRRRDESDQSRLLGRARCRSDRTHGGSLCCGDGDQGI
jgi:hypothetical protein